MSGTFGVNLRFLFLFVFSFLASVNLRKGRELPFSTSNWTCSFCESTSNKLACFPPSILLEQTSFMMRSLAEGRLNYKLGVVTETEVQKSCSFERSWETIEEHFLKADYFPSWNCHTSCWWWWQLGFGSCLVFRNSLMIHTPVSLCLWLIWWCGTFNLGEKTSDGESDGYEAVNPDPIEKDLELKLHILGSKMLWAQTCP